MAVMIAVQNSIVVTMQTEPKIYVVSVVCASWYKTMKRRSETRTAPPPMVNTAMRPMRLRSDVWRFQRG